MIEAFSLAPRERGHKAEDGMKRLALILLKCKCVGMEEGEEMKRYDSVVTLTPMGAALLGAPEKIEFVDKAEYDRVCAENSRLQTESANKDEYIKLLGEEIDDLAPLAAVHGWKSTRHEKGKEIRARLHIR